MPLCERRQTLKPNGLTTDKFHIHGIMCRYLSICMFFSFYLRNSCKRLEKMAALSLACKVFLTFQDQRGFALSFKKEALNQGKFSS